MSNDVKRSIFPGIDYNFSIDHYLDFLSKRALFIKRVYCEKYKTKRCLEFQTHWLLIHFKLLLKDPRTVKYTIIV